MKQIKKQVQKRKDNPTLDSGKVVKKERVLKKEDIPGLEQQVQVKGKSTRLHQIIKPNHVWQTKGRTVRTIITHDGVKLIADAAGVSKDVEYKILTQPDAYNNYQYTISAKVCMLKNKDDCAVEMGEANRSNLGSRGRNVPAMMAEKRAYDRAVFRLLGITGILSEEELSDEDKEDDDMHGLSHDDLRKLAPLINQITLAKSKDNLIKFNREMKDSAKKYTPEQLNYLRELYKKRLVEMQKTSF